MTDTPKNCPDCGYPKIPSIPSWCERKHTALAPAPEPPLETCPRCWGHGCYLCNHTGISEPTTAPTGTGEGSELAYDFDFELEAMAVHISAIRQENAALRSQLEEEKERADSNYASCERIKEKYSACARDLSTAQTRIALYETACGRIAHKANDPDIAEIALSALTTSPSKTGPSRTVEQDAAKSERQYDHSDPWNTMGPWDEQ